MHTGYIHTFNSRLQTINYFLKLVQTQTDTEKSKHITHTHTHKLKKLLKTKGVNYIVYSIILQGFVKSLVQLSRNHVHKQTDRQTNGRTLVIT